MSSGQAIADYITQNPSAIGYYGMGNISKHQKALPIAKDKTAEAVYPTVENVVSGKYPISRPLFMYVKNDPAGDVKKFIDFILSPEGQELVLTMDFVPIKK